MEKRYNLLLTANEINALLEVLEGYDLKALRKGHKEERKRIKAAMNAIKFTTDEWHEILGINA